MEEKSVQAELASYTGKLLREHYGKGPASVYVSIKHPFITFYLRDFLTPTESVLRSQGHDQKVEETRDLLMKDVLHELKATLTVVADLQVDNLYYDWSLENRTGIILGVLSEDQANKDEQFYEYPAKGKLHEEINRVSRQVEKEPEETNSLYLNDRTLVIQRKGILVDIEKELIRSGYEQPLRLSKRRLEKDMLDRRLYESILGVSITDLFVDWDFQLDQSFIVLIIQKNKPM
ncbi:Na-translocating system protein MpsC family protein [Pontibacillus salipaludis]|uniref:Na+-translocating membrane potential-generating system MpsC domain-containing protein n=1 Tax=Pontibacillus salipaludis TaxID=1697394 RepID=A0ABQ1QDE0_9BACI|nr:Na-translocating system protein MpsC family protein [Pontibacillus salipaludis]GGD22715.1 hypothetical protein GCM10011389_33130 [Pontibacillus salipaludis]